MSKNNIRRQLFVDSQVQGAILSRILFYWAACLMFVSLPILLVQTVMNPDVMFYDHIGQMAQRFWPIYLVLFLLLPFVLWDAAKLSNRFCGPLKRVMSSLDTYRATGEFDGISFRDDDFWHSLAESISTAMRKKEQSAGG